MLPHEASKMVSVGDKLAGKYRVERILGTGGMGVVVAARHEQLNQVRAIKLMHAGSLDDRHAVDRFIREAQAAVKLRSEHIAEVHDFGRLESGAPYIVMEFLQGEDLSMILKRSGPLSIEECIEYMMQACHALAEAHSVGIVHRDLKPGNLFLTKRNDGSPCIKVLDFGISKDLSANSTEEELTRSGVVMGTLQYMAPEQMRSAKKVDARADVYSLGAIMYKLLTGRAPFQSPQPTEIIFMTLDEKMAVRPPLELRAEISPLLDALILRCLDRDPAKRFSSAGELLAALRAFGPCAAAACDDDEKTIMRLPGESATPMRRNVRLSDTQPWFDCVPPPHLRQSGARPKQPSVVDCFPPDFYLRPPPVPEYVPQAFHRASRPEFRVHSLPGTQETMPPMEMPTAWRRSAVLHDVPKPAIAMPAAVRARARAAIERLRVASILGRMKEHPRSLVSVAVATWLVFVVLLVGFVRSKWESASALPDTSKAITTNAVPSASVIPVPAVPPVASGIYVLPAPTTFSSAPPRPAPSTGIQTPKKVPTPPPRTTGSSKRPQPQTLRHWDGGY